MRRTFRAFYEMRSILVTGASTGVGHATAERFL